MIKYVLFDLDGTLSDPRVGITTCMQLALDHFGIHVEDLKILEQYIGPPLKESFMKGYGLTDEQAEQAMEIYRSRFSVVGLYENEMYPGISQLLHDLRKEGYQLAVASSKPTVYVEQILEHFDIKQYFHYVVGSLLDGSRVDKDEVVKEALRLLGVTEETLSQTAMVGDRIFDVLGAKKNKVLSIAVSYGFGSREELLSGEPDYIVDSVKDLETLLMSLGRNDKSIL